MLVIIVLSLWTITFIFVLIRVITRVNKRVKLSGGTDDALVVGAFLASSPGAFLSPFWSQGMGKDAWTLPLEVISRSALILIIYEVLYVIAIGLAKAAILIFYIRIFPSQTLQRIAWTVICFVATYSTGFLLFGVCQCRPFAYNWRRYVDESGGKCADTATAAIIHGVLNMTIDMVILLLPMPSLYKLRVCTKKKVQIAIMFR